MHYQYFDVCITRDEIYKILKKEWDLSSFHNVAKTEKFCRGLYKLMGDKDSNQQKKAIQYARKLHSIYKGENFTSQCPCTTVYLLVEELNKYLKA